MKFRSLGSVAAAGDGIKVTGGTTATPIVATVTAGHRLKDGDRLGIVGVTGMVNMNGDWEAYSIAATAASLRGSAGVGTYGGTAKAAVLCDQSPFYPRHSAVCLIEPATLVGTIQIYAGDQRKSDNSDFQYNDRSTGVLTDGMTSALKTGEIAIPTGGGCLIEVDLARYMKLATTAFTSGSAGGGLMAD